MVLESKGRSHKEQRMTKIKIVKSKSKKKMAVRERRIKIIPEQKEV